jgi:uncharacterized protein (DUF433 family)
MMHDRIAVDAQVHFGKPCVRGTRIPVHDVLELVREAIPFAEIVRSYFPELAVEDIRACIQYAMDIVGLEEIHLTANK